MATLCLLSTCRPSCRACATEGDVALLHAAFHATAAADVAVAAEIAAAHTAVAVDARLGAQYRELVHCIAAATSVNL